MRICQYADPLAIESLWHVVLVAATNIKDNNLGRAEPSLRWPPTRRKLQSF